MNILYRLSDHHDGLIRPMRFFRKICNFKGPGVSAENEDAWLGRTVASAMHSCANVYIVAIFQAIKLKGNIIVVMRTNCNRLKYYILVFYIIEARIDICAPD